MDTGLTDPAGTAPPAFRAAGANVLGMHVSAVNLGTAADAILAAVEAGRRGYVCFAGAHAAVDCRSDPALREVFDRAHLVVPDGMPLVWALRRAGHAQSGRVYGPDMMLELFRRGQPRGLRHYLYGTTPETLRRLAARLETRFPGALVAGCFAPPFRALTAGEEEETAVRINAARADIVWVGLSTPKQDRWMAAMRPRLEAPMLLGVGAAFDFHAGLKPQAPALLQRHGLEWAYRLCSEPRRLWRRYARVVPRYLLLEAAARAGLVRFPGPESRAAGGEADR
ncbi:WecB/TagA/CpsF family glycosyltransferase [Oceanicella sp. SM1341]|uniref:WecB/TagA/CpsF family glycosyltransferase n=1 Tax=Oceanicella sp. SM1341 TaxID=1548889 RepID=UPI000E4BBABE|nr:WecB/TagA/CpsF family glycosyltransferase [Oceanicella sp. SM1341]